ncbi:MAG: hypothetical protein Q9208_007603 [Pyrenodesmia sp. 3 TL-2023]
MTSISEIQERKEHDIDQNHKSPSNDAPATRAQLDAARTLQRTYRGHRARRELKGLSLSPSARWSEAIKEAKYRDLTTPRPASRPQTSEASRSGDLTRTASDTQEQWRRVGKIARRAGGDDYTSDEGSALSPADKHERRRRREAQRAERMRTANTMDLAYFLEMVDLHHRYGSHLRKYHAEWKKQPTYENFFYWLDYGEGKHINLDNCSRERLDGMKVRYLGREERVNYAIEVDREGKLCWKRNGVRVSTTEEWRDSIKGLVRVEDEAPSPSPGLGFYVSSSESSGLSSGEDSGSDATPQDKKPKPAVAAAVKDGWKEIAHETKSKVLEHRPFKQPPREPGQKKQKEKEKKSMWIFVADTSYNLYIGIKQSGAFQHSSFLHGGRVSAAGIIKVIDGQLKYMQPRSGHYKPPASSFRAFVHSLQERGVDMSVMSVPKSYAVLIGIEGYYKGRQKIQKLKAAVKPEKGDDGEGGDGEREEERRRPGEKQREDMGGERLWGEKGANWYRLVLYEYDDAPPPIKLLNPPVLHPMSNHALFSSLLPPLARTSIRLSSSRSSSLYVCPQCSRSFPSLHHTPMIPLLPSSVSHSNHPQHPHRTFTTTPQPLSKHGGKKASKNTVAHNAAKTADDAADNPTDFSALEAQIAQIITGLREEIRRIKPGGVDVQAVEDVRVTLKKGGSADKGAKGGKDVVRIGELAQVVPRGRVLVLLVGEKEHIRPISSALASSPLALNAPPPSPHTPLELHIPIPPTTTESRQQALAAVSAKGESALFALREARGERRKHLRELKLAKKVGPDMMRRAEKELEKVNEKGVADVKKVVEAGRKALGEGPK